MDYLCLTSDEFNKALFSYLSLYRITSEQSEFIVERRRAYSFVLNLYFYLSVGDLNIIFSVTIIPVIFDFKTTACIVTGTKSY